MKTLTLWQPWASLVACGAKRFETRSWEPPRALVNERFAIHAAKREFRPATDVDVITLHHMTLSLSRAGLDITKLPHGAVVCTVLLANAVQAGRDEEAPDRFGDYSPRRWLWHLVDVLPVEPAVPWKGRQGWFNIPDSLLSFDRKA